MIRYHIDYSDLYNDRGKTLPRCEFDSLERAKQTQESSDELLEKFSKEFDVWQVEPKIADQFVTKMKNFFDTSTKKFIQRMTKNDFFSLKSLFEQITSQTDAETMRVLLLFFLYRFHTTVEDIVPIAYLPQEILETTSFDAVELFPGWIRMRQWVIKMTQQTSIHTPLDKWFVFQAIEFHDTNRELYKLWSTPNKDHVGHALRFYLWVLQRIVYFYFLPAPREVTNYLSKTQQDIYLRVVGPDFTS